MIRIEEITERIFQNNPNADVDIVERAYVYSAQVHEGQLRLSGEPYLIHPLEVAGILAEMNLDVESIAAGLLHDVVEDTHATEDEIEQMFGEKVRHIISGVTKISKLHFKTSEDRQAENTRKMILAMADDLRVILVKLADRLHNMRTLQYQKPHKQISISQETIDIYAPIASRLGIYWMKRELEDTAFKYLTPEEYKRIEDLIQRDKVEREGYVNQVIGLIKKKMEEYGLKCEVLGRYKHLYSIYQKMKDRNLPFEEIYDIRAFRVILDDTEKNRCYEALGYVHDLWKPIDYRFKDYISRPKSNMYQSIHTTVIGPKGYRIEVQIRTNEMDKVAKSGIAAHWMYKEGIQKPDQNTCEQLAWIQTLVENQENIKDPHEFLENIRLDLFPDEVYVFTPNGEAKALPKGSTPVDFAFLIHSDLGNQCIGAKINGQMVSLKYELKTCDVVQIMTSRSGHPSKDWLNFVKTVKARSRIKQWIKIQEKERSIALGREICEKEFRKYNLNFHTLLKSDEMIEAVTHFGLKTLDDLMATVGYGKITPLQLIRKLLPKDEPEPEELPLGRPLDKQQKKKSDIGVLVKGVDDILIKFAKCCRPVRGDPIVGYITRGFGVTVHHKNCVNMMKMDPERRVEVEWTPDSVDSYTVKIWVLSSDRSRLLADLADNISKNESNIIDVNSKIRRDNSLVDSFFTITVKDTEHLDKIMASIRKVKMVQDVRRITR